MTKPSSDFYFQKLTDTLRAEHMLDLSQYAPGYVKRRLNYRLQQRGLTENSLRQYIEILRSEPDEYEHFLEMLSINVTEFFRDPPLWKELQGKIFPEIIRQKSKLPLSEISIWSCGCSTGEEPYSLAMLLDELLPPPRKVQVSILATDIDRDALAHAQKGEYPDSLMKSLPTSYILKHFRASSQANHFLLSEKIRQMVVFRHHNFQMSPPRTGLDCIFCRNTLIYLAGDTKQSMFSKFHAALRPGGYLVLGKCEVFFDPERVRFAPVNADERVYAKTGQ